MASNQLFLNLAFDDIDPEEEEEEEYKPIITKTPRGRKPRGPKSNKQNVTIKKEEENEDMSQGNIECQCYYCGDMMLRKNIQDHMKSGMN